MEARQSRGHWTAIIYCVRCTAELNMPILFSNTNIHMTGAAKDTRFGMPYVTSPRADAHIHCCSGVVGHPHGAMMRSTWPGHTKIEHSAHDRARLTVNPGLVVAARIDRNRHSAVYRRAASKTYNDRWDTLCEKANLSTADFWHYHHSMDKRLPPLRLVLYEDSGTPPCHRSAAR